jgi:hypothetical protein
MYTVMMMDHVRERTAAIASKRGKVSGCVRPSLLVKLTKDDETKFPKDLPKSVRSH